MKAIGNVQGHEKNPQCTHYTISEKNLHNLHTTIWKYAHIATNHHVFMRYIEYIYVYINLLQLNCDKKLNLPMFIEGYTYAPISTKPEDYSCKGICSVCRSEN